ncbi:MAG: GNAT family N-acetyltransferase [Actinomycetes bacterium]
MVTSLTTVPVTPDRWPALEAFSGTNGMYANCWCVYWRRTTSEFDAGIADHGAGNRELLARLTRDGAVPGLLAYEDERPVGWVSVAPREQFGRILRSPRLRPDPDDPDEPGDSDTWAVVCFWVPRRERGRGVARVLLDAAVDYARSRGAVTVEGYPVDTEARSPASSIFTGTLALFTEAGFREVRRRGGRPTVRRDA